VRDSPAVAEARIQRTYGHLVALVFVAYLAIAIGLYLWRGVAFAPDGWLILFLVGAIVLGRAVAFMRDWVPVVLLIAGYELMRKLAGRIVAEQDLYVHVRELIHADQAIFGGALPTRWLQDHLFVRGEPHWYDFLALVVYTLHFVFPLAFAFMLWLQQRQRFWQFSLTFLVMSYTAFLCFLFYPAAPPWFANRYRYLIGIEWPASQAYRALVPSRLQEFDTFVIWDQISSNAVAAMPSLHAAFPWLVLLFAIKFYGRRGLLFLPYSPILWFSIVYLAHHWVIDILAGVAWATVCFVAVQLAWPRIAWGFTVPMPQVIGARLQRIRAATATLLGVVGWPLTGSDWPPGWR
jgi:hypothetical protein